MLEARIWRLEQMMASLMAAAQAAVKQRGPNGVAVLLSKLWAGVWLGAWGIGDFACWGVCVFSLCLLPLPRVPGKVVGGFL